MATRMQQRRGTAAQWISTNSGNGPILNAGEIGYETDTNKFKIGDGTNHWINLDYFIDASSTANPSFGTSITFEGATADSYETTLQVTDPTADRTITFPDATGTVVLADGSGNVTVSGDLTVSGTTTTINSTTINATTGIVFEGATADAFETTLTVTDPTADRTITFPDATGTVALTSALSSYAPLASPTFTGTVTLPSGTVTSTMILDGTIATADIADSAVTSAKIADGTIVAGDIADGAITSAKILDGTIATADIADSAITSTKIANDTIVDADINSAAAIAWTKIAPSSTVSSTELGYLDGVTSAIQTQMDTKAPLAAPAFTGTATAVNLTISGDLTVNGTTTNINSTSLVVEDKNVVLGDVATPSDTTADGGGITLKGATDKTFNWVDSTDAWTSSEHINLASGKTLKYNGTDLVAAQSGNSGKYLTTDGTSTSWSVLEAGADVNMIIMGAY